jgi:hypothetical protein
MVTYGENVLIIAEVDARGSFTAGPTRQYYMSVAKHWVFNRYFKFGYDSETFSYLMYVKQQILSLVEWKKYPDALTDQNALLREIFQERYIYLGSYEL